MKKIGEVRRIDNIGRIIIPKLIRERLKIKPEEEFECYLTEEGGILFLPLKEFDKRKETD